MKTARRFTKVGAMITWRSADGKGQEASSEEAPEREPGRARGGGNNGDPGTAAPLSPAMPHEGSKEPSSTKRRSKSGRTTEQGASEFYQPDEHLRVDLSRLVPPGDAQIHPAG